MRCSHFKTSDLIPSAGVGRQTASKRVGPPDLEQHPNAQPVGERTPSADSANLYDTLSRTTTSTTISAPFDVGGETPHSLPRPSARPAQLLRVK
jgi:hypothetical protein